MSSTPAPGFLASTPPLLFSWLLWPPLSLTTSHTCYFQKLVPASNLHTDVKKIIPSQTTKLLVLYIYYTHYPWANLKIIALHGCFIADFKQPSPAWSHRKLKWGWRRKVEKDWLYLLISWDEKWLERHKRNDNNMVHWAHLLLFISR